MPAPFFYNRKGLIDAVFDQHDWAPTQSESAQSKVGRFLDRGLVTLSEDAPFLFFERELRLSVHPDQFPEDVDTLQTTTDAWVLRTTLAVGDADALVWESDRDWGARILMVLMPKASADDDDEWHSIRIREVWEADSGGTDYVFISLETPWRNVSDTGMRFRVVNHEYVFPDNIVEIHSLSIMESNTSFPYPLSIVGQGQAESSAYPNHSELQASGVPRVAYRREYQQKLRAPTAITAANHATTVWTGPEPIGTFEYLITYSWGTQESWTHAPGPTAQSTVLPDTVRMEPYWESAPSPSATATVTTGIGSLPGLAAQLTLPNIDFTLGFSGSSTVRYRRAGIKKRIWRRRTAITSAANTTEDIDATDGFFLLDTVDGHITDYVDIGAITPDYNRMLREVHGYQTFKLYPRPDQRFEMVLRATLTPEPLVNDTDVPAVKKGATEALIHLVSAMLFDAEGNTSQAQREELKYEKALHRMKKRYGDMRPASRPRRRRTARPRAGYQIRRNVAGVVRNS